MGARPPINFWGLKTTPGVNAFNLVSYYFVQLSYRIGRYERIANRWPKEIIFFDFSVNRLAYSLSFICSICKAKEKCSDMNSIEQDSKAKALTAAQKLENYTKTRPYTQCVF